MTLKKLTQLMLKQAKDKGFGTKPDEIDVPEKIALIHSEVTEAYIAYRKKDLVDNKDKFAAELGDIVQRVFHLAGVLNIDLEDEILRKVDQNKKRVWDWEKVNDKTKHFRGDQR